MSYIKFITDSLEDFSVKAFAFIRSNSLWWRTVFIALCKIACAFGGPTRTVVYLIIMSVRYNKSYVLSAFDYHINLIITRLSDTKWEKYYFGWFSRVSSINCEEYWSLTGTHKRKIWMCVKFFKTYPNAKSMKTKSKVRTYLHAPLDSPTSL